MIREIFVPLLCGNGDDAALDAASALAHAHQAHVSAMVSLARPLPVVSEMGMGKVPLPSVPFRVEASGTDAKGRAFKRIYPMQFEAQPVAVEAKGGFTVAEVRPSMLEAERDERSADAQESDATDVQEQIAADHRPR